VQGQVVGEDVAKLGAAQQAAGRHGQTMARAADINSCRSQAGKKCTGPYGPAP
jgi:hypothetical protein